MSKKITLLTTLVIGVFFTFVSLTQANNPYQLNPSQAGLNSGSYVGIVNAVVGVGLFAAGAAGVIFLIYGSINYITAGGDETKATAARRSIINSIIGLVLVTMTFFIVRNAINFGNLFNSSSAEGNTDQLKNP